MSNNIFLRTNRFNDEKQIKTSRLFCLENEAFPDLTNVIQNTSKNTSNFKDVLINVVETVSVNKKNIEPGLVQITNNFGKYVTKTQQYNTYNMNDAISDMNKNWKNYEREYDSINGENSYAQNFTMKPIYDHSYDTEDEDSSDGNSDDNSDYSSDNEYLN